MSSMGEIIVASAEILHIAKDWDFVWGSRLKKLHI